MKTYDLAIIGGGPAGYVAAERAGAAGLKTIVFDMRELGGVCLNEGCIPTKTLLYTAKMYDHALHGDVFGIRSENVTLDFSKIMKRKNKVVRKLVGGVSAKMKKNNVEVVKDKANIEKRVQKGCIISDTQQQYQAERILIATGSEAAIPPIPGLDETTFYTNREILQLTEIPESLNIIGGGVIGVEFANIFNAFGTKVTVFEMLDEILPGIDPEFCKMLRTELSKKGVEFHLNTSVTEIRNNEVIAQKEGKAIANKAEKLLVCVGRKMNVEDLGFENIGLDYSTKGITIDKNCRTNIPQIYAAGDVTGFSLLAHTAYREAEVAVNHMLGKPDRMRYNAIPAVIYTNPEISCVGLTEKAAWEKQIPYSVHTLPMTYAGRFIAENENFNGLCKILVGKKHHEILGVHMIGNPSSEIIYGAAMAIEMQMRMDDVKEIVFPHPTVSEIFREVVFDF
jgi:dihydrolipoamide dehydrogenase